MKKQRGVCLRGHHRDPHAVGAALRRCSECVGLWAKQRRRKRRGLPLNADIPLGRPRVPFCKRGHARTPKNLAKSRACRICLREGSRAKYRISIGVPIDTPLRVKRCAVGHPIWGANRTTTGKCKQCERDYQRARSRSRRGLAPDAPLAVGTPRRALCKRGHPRTPENLLRDGHCRACGLVENMSEDRHAKVLERGRRRMVATRFCACAHPRRTHEEGECYHKNPAGEFDCECVSLRIAA